MNDTGVMEDALWSIVLIIGIARVASALAGWPGSIPDAAADRSRLAGRLLQQLRRGVLGGALVALALAGLFRHWSIVVQLPMWVASAAMAWSVYVALIAHRLVDEQYRVRLRRVAQCASAALWASVVAAIVIVGRLLVNWRPSVWLVVAGALLYIGIRVYALIEQAAADVQAFQG